MSRRSPCSENILRHYEPTSKVLPRRVVRFGEKPTFLFPHKAAYPRVGLRCPPPSQPRRALGTAWRCKFMRNGMSILHTALRRRLELSQAQGRPHNSGERPPAQQTSYRNGKQRQRNKLSAISHRGHDLGNITHGRRRTEARYATRFQRDAARLVTSWLDRPGVPCRTCLWISRVSMCSCDRERHCLFPSFVSSSIEACFFVQAGESVRLSRGRGRIWGRFVSGFVGCVRRTNSRNLTTSSSVTSRAQYHSLSA